jgi:hypothetical protein
VQLLFHSLLNPVSDGVTCGRSSKFEGIDVFFVPGNSPQR